MRWSKPAALTRTAVVRLCGPATRALPPFVDWPERLREAVDGRVFLVAGGHEFDGREIVPVDDGELAAVAAEIRSAGLRSVAVSSVFSPVDDRHERQAAEVTGEIAARSCDAASRPRSGGSASSNGRMPRSSTPACEDSPIISSPASKHRFATSGSKRRST